MCTCHTRQSAPGSARRLRSSGRSSGMRLAALWEWPESIYMASHYRSSKLRSKLT